MGLILIAFLLMFIYAQSREKGYKPFGRKYSKEASVYLVFLIGNWLTFGALEDFGWYIIWGLDKFYEYAQYIHQDRFFLGIPTLYYMIIPGIIIQIITLWISRRWKSKI